MLNFNFPQKKISKNFKKFQKVSISKIPHYIVTRTRLVQKLNRIEIGKVVGVNLINFVFDQGFLCKEEIKLYHIMFDFSV